MNEVETVYSSIVNAQQFVMAVPLCTMPEELEQLMIEYCIENGIQIKTQLYGNQMTKAISKKAFFQWAAMVFSQGLNTTITNDSTKC